MSSPSAINPLKKSIRLALIQLAASTASKPTNIELARTKVLKAAQNGAQVIVLPECFNSPYGVKYFAQYAETIPIRFLKQLPAAEVPKGLLSQLSESQSQSESTTTTEDEMSPTVAALSRLAKETKTYLIGGSIPELEPGTGSLFNTSLTFNPSGTLLAIHRKVHLFDIDIPGGITFRESDALSGGNNITTFAIPDVGRIAVGICYDIRFPEPSIVAARGLALQEGVFALVFPAAFNTTTGPMHWELLARARAVDNQVYVALCSPARNIDAEYHAYGHSMIVDPAAKVIEEAGEGEEILYANLDPAAIEKTRQNIPVTKQRRFDVYTDVTIV